MSKPSQDAVGMGGGRRLVLVLAASAGFLTPGASPLGALRMLAVVFVAVFFLTLLWSVLTETTPAQQANDAVRRRYPAGAAAPGDVALES